jgi:proteasome accessory factor B
MAREISKMTRLMKLVAMLRKNSYPNHRKLQSALNALSALDEYTVSQKTVQRDVQYLKDVYHAPIEFDNGKRGYYLTDQHWNFEVPSLDADEMRAVTLGARLAETIMPEPVASEIQDAAETLLCENPTGLDANAALIALVAKGARIPVEPAIFREVFAAWQTRHGLAVKYQKGMSGKVLEYVLEPQVLSFYDGLWYVKAVVVSCDGETLPERTIRTLALNRILFAAIYPGRFEPDMRLINEVNEGKLFDFPTIDEVVLRFTDHAIPYARENYDPALIEEQPDGSLLVTIYDAIDFKIVNLVLNEGGAVQVVSPPELAQKVVEQAGRVIKAHSPAGARS